MLHIRKNDIVYVIAGKDKGKTGRVLHVFHEEQRAVVENINVVKKSQRKTQDKPQGGFVEIEAPIHISNLMLFDKKISKPTRFGALISKGKPKIRISRKSNEVI